MPGDVCAKTPGPWPPGTDRFLAGLCEHWPYLWQVDPSAQDLDQIGIGPGADRSVTLAAPFETWLPTTSHQRWTTMFWALPLAMPANTQAVRLVWTMEP